MIIEPLKHNEIITKITQERVVFTFIYVEIFFFIGNP